MYLHGFKTLDATASNSSVPQGAKLNIVSLIFGLIGFGLSLYALTLHVKAKSSSGALGCDVSDLVNCSKVIGGEYGEFVSIPLGAFGMAYFGLVIAVALLPVFVFSSVAWIARWQMLVAAVGASVSLLLAYISYFKIQAVCLVCSGVHVLSVMNFIWTLVGFLRVRNQPQSVAEGGFVKLVAACLALGVPPLFAGALVPLVSATLENDKKAEPSEISATPFPSDWVSFSVSNYVGQGEDYRKGNDQAKVVVHMFSDLECPHCKTTAEAIEAAQSVVGADLVLFVYRNYPLSNKCNASIGGEGHAHACDLAMALRCAGSQSREAFWDFKNWAFSGIDMNPEERKRSFTIEGMRTHAEKLKLDGTRFEACLRDKIELPKIQADIDIGKKMGLTGTPLVVIDGQTYRGERTPQALTRAFREALSTK